VTSWETVRVELDDGIAWVELNRPEKRNAMNPTLNREMVEALLELDEAPARLARISAALRADAGPAS